MDNFNWLIWLYAVYVIVINVYLRNKISKKIEYFEGVFRQTMDYAELQTLFWYITLLRKLSFGYIPLLALQLGVLALAAIFVTNLDDTSMRLTIVVLSISISIFFALLWKTSKGDQTNMEESLANDKRDPVLYLRSFKIDGSAPNGVYQSLSPIAKKIFTYETAAIGMAEAVGPVVAVAAPFREIDQDIGASKGHFDDWKLEIKTLMKTASIIIFCPYDSNGLFWEFCQIIELGLLDKTIMYAVNFDNKIKPDGYNHFRSMVLSHTGFDVGEFNPLMPYVFFGPDNVVWETNDEFDIPLFRKTFYNQCLAYNPTYAEIFRKKHLLRKLKGYN